MKLDGIRKEQGVEVANREHVKGPGEWPTGGAGWPGPVAILGGPFCTGSGSVCSAPVMVFW